MAPVPPVSPYSADAGETPHDARPWLDVGSYHDMVVVGPPLSPRPPPPPPAAPGPGLGLGPGQAPQGSAAASPSRTALAPLLSGGFGVTQRFYPGPAFGRLPACAAGNPEPVPEGGAAPASPVRGASLTSACSSGFERMVLPQARPRDALPYVITSRRGLRNEDIVHKTA